MTNYKQTPHSATGPAAAAMDAGVGNTYGCFYMRVVSAASDSNVALETSPDGTTWTQAATVRGDGWCFARSDARTRQARSNVISLGTGALPLSAIVTSGP
jgi:hypothetical protein